MIIADVEGRCASGVTFVDEPGTRSVQPGHCYVMTSPDMNVELRNVEKDGVVFHARNWLEVKSTVNASMVVGCPKRTLTPITFTPIHDTGEPSNVLVWGIALVFMGLVGLAVKLCCHLAKETVKEQARRPGPCETPLATVEPGRIIIYTNSQTQNATRNHAKDRDIKEPLISAVPTPEPPADSYQIVADEPSPYQIVADAPNPYANVDV